VCESLLLARGAHYTATGNSDSHTVRLQVVGYPRTYVRVAGGRVSDAREVVRALRAGHAFVTSGPFLEATVEGRGPGDMATVAGGVAHVHVVVRAPPWISTDELAIYVGPSVSVTRALVVPPARGAGQSAHRRGGAPPSPPPPPPVQRLDATIDVAVSGDTFVVVTVRGRTGIDAIVGRGGSLPVAFTNPIWLDVDGDGRVVLTPPGDVPGPDSTAALPDGGGDGALDGGRDAATPPAAAAPADAGGGAVPAP